MLRTAIIALRAHPWRMGCLFVFVALAALLLRPNDGHADATPFPIQGDDADNTITISVTIDDQVEFCVDDFCADQPMEEVQTIDVFGLGGNDTIVIDETNGIFVNPFTGNITINVDGGAGNNVLEICPAETGFCSSSEIESTTWTPGPDINAGSIQQTSPEGTTSINAVNTGSVIDGAPGELIGNGTPGDDAITYTAGPLTDATQAYGLVTVNNLTSYEFTNKSSLEIYTGSGVDTVQDNQAGTPTGMTETCDGVNSVCVIGGGSPDDSLVVNGVPGSTDTVSVTPADGAGSIDGVADSPRLGYEGVSAIKLVLQYGGDGDTAQFAGSPGDDLVQIASSTLPGEATVTGTYDQDGAPFQLPTVTVEGGSPGAAGALSVAAGEGTDALTYIGTDQADTFATQHTGDIDVLAHTAGSTLVETVALTGFESYDLEGLAGDDTMNNGDSSDSTATPFGVPTSWNGGTGSDALAYAAASAAGTVTAGNGVVQQPGSAPATTASVEDIDVDAAGNAMTMVGTAGSDTMNFAPTGANSGRLFSSSDPTAYTVSAVGGLFTIDPLDGTDEVDVNGTAAADDIPLTRAPSGTLTVQVGSVLPVRISSGAEAAQVFGLGSGDRFLVGGTGGPASLTLNGGPDAGSDRILLGGNIADATVTGAPASATGQLTAGGPAIAFAGIGHVSAQGDGTGSLTVNADPNVVALTQTGASVELSDGITVDYSAYQTLALEGGTDTDHISVDPAHATVTQLDVDGGPGGATRETLIVLGTALSDTATYRPTAPAAGEVDLTAHSPVTFASIGSVVLNGNTDSPSGDGLLVDTSQIHGTQVLDPGANFDGGTVHFRSGGGTTNTGPTLTFGQLGAGSVSFTDTSRVDDLIYNGTSASDNFGVDSSGVVSLNSQIPVSTPGVATLELRGSSGADTFDLPPTHPFPGTADGPGIITDGGTAATGDRVQLDASGDDVSVDYADHSVTAGASARVGVPAIQYVDVAGASDLSVLGTTDADVLRYTPTGAQAGGFARDTGSLEVHFTRIAGPVRADGRDGADTIAVNATSAPDAISIARGDPSTVQVGSLKALDLPAATEALQVTGGAGGDTFTVTGSGGPAALSVDGGGPAGVGDRLDFRGAAGTVVAGVVPYNGNIHAPSGDVGYVNLDVVAMHGDSTGSLSVVGSSGNDAVSVGVANVPAVQVNAGTEIRYDGYPNLSVDGGNGGDSIDMSYEHIGDIQSLTLAGGNQLADHLAVLDRPGATDTVRVVPTGPNAGTLTVDGLNPAIAFGGVASLALDGNGSGDHVVVKSASGDNAVHVTPGASDDAATVRIDALVPFSFQNLGSGGTLQLVDADRARADNLTYDGTGGNDHFAVAGDTGTITLNSRLPVVADGVSDLMLHGQDGDDTFGLVGPLPFATSTLDGGAAGPAGDTLNVSGATSDVSVDFGNGQVTGYGGTVQYPGMETVNTDASTRSLTVLGSSGDDTLCYDPMSLTNGRAYLMGVSGSGDTSTVCDTTQRGPSVLNNFTSVGQLFLDPGAGVDQVIVDGTAADDLVTLLATYPWVTVNVHPQSTDPNTTRLTASIANANTENLAVHALDGQDDIDVHPYDNSAPTFYLDGGSPINKSAGDVADQMEVHDGGGVAHLHTYKAHVFGTGEVTAAFRDGIEQDFNYFDVESLKTIQNSK